MLSLDIELSLKRWINAVTWLTFWFWRWEIGKAESADLSNTVLVQSKNLSFCP